MRRLVTTVLLLASVAPAAGQQARLRGTVRDQLSSGLVPGTALELIDATNRRVGQTLSDSAGAFGFLRLAPGTYRLRAQALGFTRVETPEFHVADSAEVVVWLSAQALPLAPLEIVARAQPVHRHFGVREFYERMERRAGGTFVTKEEIAIRSPYEVSDLMNTVGSFEASRRTRQLFNIRNPGCAPAVYVDGVRLTRSDTKGEEPARVAYQAVNTLSPADIEGIEIYSGGSTVPAAYSGTGGGCGVILIWAKRQ